MGRVDVKNRIANFIAINFRNIGGGYFGRQKFIFLYWIYHFLPYLGFDYCRLQEWKFILNNLDKREKMNILDVGCVYSLFIYYLTKYGNIFGLDTQPYPSLTYAKNIRFVQGSILNSPFPDNYFDCITLISVIEHIGLGAYSDPFCDDGDFKAMQELKRIVKKGASIFLTTVIANQYVISEDGNQRIYDDKRLERLAQDLFLDKQEYYIFRKRWIMVSKKEAFQESPKRFGLACLKLIK